MKEIIFYKDNEEFLFNLLEYNIQKFVTYHSYDNSILLYVRIDFNNNRFFQNFQKITTKFQCKIIEDDYKNLFFSGCLINEIKHDYVGNNIELYINSDYFKQFEDTLTQVRFKKIMKIFNENINTH